MYTIAAARALKFVTANYIPVQQVQFTNTVMATATQENTWQRDVENAAVDGAIQYFKKTANGSVGGSEYYLFEQSTLNNGFGSGYSHTANTFRIDNGAAATNDIWVGSDIYFTSGNAQGKGGTITAYDGTTKAVTIGNDITVPADGDSYSIAPKLTITGDGDANANARANGANTTGITDVMTIGAGANYTNAVVTITANSSWDPSDGAVQAVIEPKGGHGYDAIEELGGYNIMVNVRLENAEGGEFTVRNDFRKIGLISHPMAANTSNGASTGIPAITGLADQALSLIHISEPTRPY